MLPIAVSGQAVGACGWGEGCGWEVGASVYVTNRLQACPTATLSWAAIKWRARFLNQHALAHSILHVATDCASQVAPSPDLASPHFVCLPVSPAPPSLPHHPAPPCVQQHLEKVMAPVDLQQLELQWQLYQQKTAAARQKLSCASVQVCSVLPVVSAPHGRGSLARIPLNPTTLSQLMH